MPIRAWAQRKGESTLTRPAPSELPPLISDPDVMLWVDLDAEGPSEEKLLVEGFGLHPLVVEDIFSESLPKLEIHGDFTYVIIHGIDRQHTKPRDFDTLEPDIILGESFLLTHHHRKSRSVEAVAKLVGEMPELMAQGPQFLAHAVIDRLVDKYLPLMEEFGRVIDSLELEILRGPGSGVLERIFDLKRSLGIMRRIGPHQRDLLMRLADDELELVSEDARPFFGDVYDHFLSATDLSDGFRELVGAVLDGYVSVQSHRLNEIMKVLTLISTVMLPLTFITGLYGMNFEVIPELSWRWGYAYAWGAMLLVASGFLVYFKRKRWF